MPAGTCYTTLVPWVVRVIIDQDGTVLASKTMEHGVSVPRPAWAEQDAEEITGVNLN